MATIPRSPGNNGKVHSKLYDKCILFHGFKNDWPQWIRGPSFPKNMTFHPPAFSYVTKPRARGRRLPWSIISLRLPSRGRVHIPPGEKETHRLKSTFWWDMLVPTPECVGPQVLLNCLKIGFFMGPIRGIERSPFWILPTQQGFFSVIFHLQTKTQKKLRKKGDFTPKIQAFRPWNPHPVATG